MYIGQTISAIPKKGGTLYECRVVLCVTEKVYVECQDAIRAVDIMNTLDVLYKNKAITLEERQLLEQKHGHLDHISKVTVVEAFFLDLLAFVSITTLVKMLCVLNAERLANALCSSMNCFFSKVQGIFVNLEGYRKFRTALERSVLEGCMSDDGLKRLQTVCLNKLLTAKSNVYRQELADKIAAIVCVRVHSLFDKEACLQILEEFRSSIPRDVDEAFLVFSYAHLLADLCIEGSFEDMLVKLAAMVERYREGNIKAIAASLCVKLLHLQFKPPNNLLMKQSCLLGLSFLGEEDDLQSLYYRQSFLVELLLMALGITPTTLEMASHPPSKDALHKSKIYIDALEKTMEHFARWNSAMPLVATIRILVCKARLVENEDILSAIDRLKTAEEVCNNYKVASIYRQAICRYQDRLLVKALPQLLQRKENPFLLCLSKNLYSQLK